MPAIKDKPNGRALAVREEAIDAALVPANDASEAFGHYAKERDELLGTPFIQNRALARSGSPFTITKAVERTKLGVEGTDRAGQTIETYMYRITLQAPVTIVDETTTEETTFEAGAVALLELERLAGPRAADFDMASALLAQHGSIPNLALQEYPASKKGRSNSFGLIDAKRWRTVQEVAKERGLTR